MKSWLRRLVLAVAFGSTLGLNGAEPIPPAPARYFNDYAKVVSPAVAEELNAQLDQFERTSSNQLLVAIYPRMESDSAVADYTVRVAQAWKPGQKTKDNGAVLFAFMQERQLYLQVGYGLEPVLPDATAKRIIENEIVPRFRRGDIDGGMRSAVSAMIAATKGEYTGSGSTQNDQRQRGAPGSFGFFALVVLFIFISSVFRRRSQRTYVFGGPRGGGWWMGPPRGGGGGWSSGGGGGGFSGGGGSFGGGGAGGKW